MQEAMLACVDIYRPEYTLLEDLGLLNYTSNPTKPAAKFTVMPQEMSMRRLPMAWFCEMVNSAIGEGGKLLEYKQLIANLKTQAKWTHSYGNKIGCLTQGMPGCNTGTHTIIFLRKNQVPTTRAKDVTYGLITCLVRPEKLDKLNGTRLVAGGDRVHYPGNAGTPTANLITIKILINSIISTAGAKLMTMDIKDFYLNTPMARYEYMQLLQTCRTMSSSTTTSGTKPPPMAIFTAKYKRGCMACHRPVSSPNNFLKNACRNMATVKARQSQV